MPAIRLVMDKKMVTRYLEAYDESNELLASRGDVLHEWACSGDVVATSQQCDTLAKLLQDSGLQLELSEDGSLRLLA